ncbi:MAG: enoyl-CoA hydratase-related protein [Bacillota bacterium]|nr:enoyl-CoA hydratase-related protein [Bacillota bacterium]MDW7676115.1 enoyl-CoA hydratase-related protein [Bacillota bacterium]
MNFKNLLFKKENHIAILSINRPDQLNALNTSLLNELDEALERIRKDEQIFVFIVTGVGRAFVAGADIIEMKELNPESARKFAEKGSAVLRKIEQMEKPSIAAVNGFALGGGCELAMACDIRIASEKAKFGQPEIGLGIIPGFSGNIRLSSIVGQAKAKELIFTCDIIKAKEALELGLVNAVYDHEEFMERTLKMAETIASKAQLAVRYAKTAITRSAETDTETGMVLENSLFGLCFATEDQEEGMNAFINKRKPEFRAK